MLSFSTIIIENADRRSSVLDESHEKASNDGSSEDDLTATLNIRSNRLAAKTIITELSHELEASRRREVEAEYDHAEHVGQFSDSESGSDLLGSRWPIWKRS